MLIKEKKISSFICINKRKEKKNSLLDNLKKIQFSNKNDKNLSSNMDNILYGK